MRTIAAEVEQIATGFIFTEGPAWLPDGSLLFSDIPNNVINRWTQDGSVSVWREKSGCTGDCRWWYNAGSNGLTLDRAGRVLICEHGNRRVTRVEQNGSLTVLATHYDGKRLNSPNDIVVHKSGAIYFTDPPYGLELQDDDPAKELAFSGVYRLLPTGELTLLTAELRRPNGLAFSPDHSFLYVGNSERERMIWMRYPLSEDGTLGSGAVFHDATGHTAHGVPDGFRVQADGTLYCTGPGGVLVISPDGEYRGTVTIPEVTSNCEWGGDDLYVTATTSVYRVCGLSGRASN